MSVRILLCFSVLLTVFSAHSSPWINPDDRFLHSSLQLLQKSGKISLPLSSYPVSWVAVVQQLGALDRSKLTDAELLAVSRLMTAADFARAENIQTLILSASTEPVGSGLQGARFDEAALLGVMSEHKGYNWAVGLRTNFRVDARDDKEQHFDGSYAAYTFDNWIISFSQQQLWLGSTQSQGEQLSWQGRAPKTIQLSRLNPSLSLFSDELTQIPTAIRLIVGEMPGSVSLRDARFAIASINVLPSARIELGMTYAQLRDLPETDALVSQVISSEPIHELQFDFRYLLGTAGLYGQINRQDNAQASANQYSIGTDLHLWLNGWQSTFFAEYRYLQRDFFNWRQPESFQQSPLIEPLAIKNNKVLGAYFYRAAGVGLSLKINHLEYDINGLDNSHLLYHLGGQYPLWRGLLTAELQHSAKKVAEISSRWQGAVRYEYRW